MQYLMMMNGETLYLSTIESLITKLWFSEKPCQLGREISQFCVKKGEGFSETRCPSPVKMTY